MAKKPANKPQKGGTKPTKSSKPAKPQAAKSVDGYDTRTFHFSTEQAYDLMDDLKGTDGVTHVPVTKDSKKIVISNEALEHCPTIKYAISNRLADTAIVIPIQGGITVHDISKDKSLYRILINDPNLAKFLSTKVIDQNTPCPTDKEYMVNFPKPKPGNVNADIDELTNDRAALTDILIGNIGAGTVPGNAGAPDNIGKFYFRVEQDGSKTFFVSKEADGYKPTLYLLNANLKKTTAIDSTSKGHMVKLEKDLADRLQQDPTAQPLIKTDESGARYLVVTTKDTAGNYALNPNAILALENKLDEAYIDKLFGASGTRSVVKIDAATDQRLKDVVTGKTAIEFKGKDGTTIPSTDVKKYEVWDFISGLSENTAYKRPTEKQFRNHGTKTCNCYEAELKLPGRKSVLAAKVATGLAAGALVLSSLYGFFMKGLPLLKLDSHTDTHFPASGTFDFTPGQMTAYVPTQTLNITLPDQVVGGLNISSNVAIPFGDVLADVFGHNFRLKVPQSQISIDDVLNKTGNFSYTNCIVYPSGATVWENATGNYSLPFNVTLLKDGYIIEGDFNNTGMDKTLVIRPQKDAVGQIQSYNIQVTGTQGNGNFHLPDGSSDSTSTIYDTGVLSAAGAFLTAGVGGLVSYFRNEKGKEQYDDAKGKIGLFTDNLRINRGLRSED